LAHPWRLEVACPGARSVTVHVRIEAGGSVTLHADGDGASPDRTAGPTGGPPAALTVSATTLETVSATLSGAPPSPGWRCSSRSVRCSVRHRSFGRRTPAHEPGRHRPRRRSDGLRRHPAHGWCVEWADALAPADWSDHHRFATGTRARRTATPHASTAAARASSEAWAWRNSAAAPSATCRPAAWRSGCWTRPLRLSAKWRSSPRPELRSSPPHTRAQRGRHRERPQAARRRHGTRRHKQSAGSLVGE
jgi:hypothetical protein